MLVRLGWSSLLRSSPTEGELGLIHAHRPAPTAILFHRQRLREIRRLNGIVWADTLPYIGESCQSGGGPRRPFSELARSIGVSGAGAGGLGGHSSWAARMARPKPHPQI